MSGHKKIAKRGGDVLQICGFMTNIIRLKKGLKNINLCLYDRYFYVFVFLGMLQLSAIFTPIAKIRTQKQPFAHPTFSRHFPSF